MSHPSIFELARFIEGDTESADFEAHVSTCDACAARLQGLAVRAVSARGLSLDVAGPERRAPAALLALMALTACCLVLLSLPLRAGGDASVAWTPPPSTAFAPEGTHGVPLPMAGFVDADFDGLADAGAVMPSGEP